MHHEIIILYGDFLIIIIICLLFDLFFGPLFGHTNRATALPVCLPRTCACPLMLAARAARAARALARAAAPAPAFPVWKQKENRGKISLARNETLSLGRLTLTRGRES